MSTLTTEEKLSGSILSDLQKQVIELRIRELEMNIINLEYDEHSPMKFVQQREFLKGALGELRYMLACSDACVSALE